MKKIDITKFFNIKNLKKIVQIIFTDHLDTQHQQLSNYPLHGEQDNSMEIYY